VPAQFNFKANHAYDARSWTGWVLREQLEQLTGNPTEGGAPEGILLLNPGPERRQVMLTVPTRLVTGEWLHHPGRVHNLEVPAARLADDEEREIGPYAVEAMSTCFVPAAELRALPDNTYNCHAAAGVIESGFYRLEADPASGRVSRLFDKVARREILDTASPWDFFGFVQETVDPNQHHGQAKYHGRDALFDTDFAKLSVAMQSGWQPNWPALRRKPGRPDRIEFVNTSLGPQLVLHWSKAPGVTDLKLSIRLAADRPAILLEAAFHKTSSLWAESSYLTFPLPLAPWQAWYDVAGQAVALDDEQLPGTVRDYATVGTWLAVADAAQCVTLACPDAPMVQVGGFHFGQTLSKVPRHANCLLLGWPLNNYWDTNFPASQPGFKRFRYELTSAPGFDAAAAMRFGQAAATPVEYHPVLRHAALTAGLLLDKDNPNVLLTALRPTRDRAGWLLHLTNPTGAPQAVRLRLPLPWQRAFRSNALEDKLSSIATGERRLGGGGQEARATVSRSACPAPSGAKPGVWGEAPALDVLLDPRSHSLVRLE